MTNGTIKPKVFVSYKYKDWNVSSAPVSEYTPGEDTDHLYTPRHYVDKIIETFGKEYIYKGERGDEGMDDFSDDTIYSKLKQKIFDSSITVVLISPRMWDASKLEKDQWIPKEVAYSLRNKTIGERKSKTNGMFVVALPDMNDSYDYAVVNQDCGVWRWQTNTFFRIIRENMFNRRNKKHEFCRSCWGYHHYGDDHSYIHPVKWEHFIANPSAYIEHATALREREDEFEDLTKTHE